jgi:hypothetical protein
MQITYVKCEVRKNAVVVNETFEFAIEILRDGKRRE